MSVFDKSVPDEQMRKARGKILDDIGGDNPFLDQEKKKRYEQARTLTAKLALLHHERFSKLSSEGPNRKEFGAATAAMVSKFIQTGEMPDLSLFDQTQESVAEKITTVLKPFAQKASYPTEAPPGVKTNYESVLRQHGLNDSAIDKNAVGARQFAEYLLFKATGQLAREQLAQSAPPSVPRV